MQQHPTTGEDIYGVVGINADECETKLEYKMNWKYIKKVKDIQVFERYARRHRFVMSKGIMEFLSNHNNGRPEICEIAHKGIILILHKFLDFNDEEYLDILIKSMPKKRLFPFARDTNGNVYCFDFNSAGDPKIVYWDHEEGTTEVIAKDIDELLRNLE